MLGVNDSEKAYRTQIHQEMQSDLTKTQQANDDLRTHLREKEYEIQSLQNVNLELYNFARDTLLKLHK